MQPARRQVLGQWFTPAPVADLALALALPAQRTNARVLDPACGDGVFLSRAERVGLKPDQLFGIELDPSAVRLCRKRLPAATVDQANLFSVAPANPGFDAVVGNPPYVRQERLTPVQKQRARDRLVADWPELPAAELRALLGRGDLAAAFLLRSLRFVRPGGRLSFVVSSALLDAGYANRLWSLINQVARVVAIVDAPAERWFREAAVNTMIVCIERTPATAADMVTVARLQQPTTAAAQVVRGIDDLNQVAELRRVSATKPAQWSSQVRASSAWFTFAEQASELLVPLSSLADIRRGVTSGANTFFYMTRDQAVQRGIEPELLMPLVRSPRERGAAMIAIDPDHTSHVALVCPDDLTAFPGARAYVDANAKMAERPTLRSRQPWWTLPCIPARLFLTKAYSARFVQRLSAQPLLGDQRVYAVYPHADVDTELLAAVLNATYTAFALESLGRASLGEGALEWTVADAAQLPVIDVRRLDKSSVHGAFAALMQRPVLAVRAESERDDRRALDQAIAAAIGRDVDLDAIHAALADAVDRRCSRGGRYLSV